MSYRECLISMSYRSLINFQDTLINVYKFQYGFDTSQYENMSKEELKNFKNLQILTQASSMISIRN